MYTRLWFRKFLQECHNGTTSRIKRLPTGILPSSILAVGGLLYFSHNHIVHGDSAPRSKLSVQLPHASNASGRDEDLQVIGWGSNKVGLLSPLTPDIESVKTPSLLTWLGSAAFRDLALHRKHAACVDARGDVYQWGDSRSDSKHPLSGPTLTLRGKNIIRVELTESRIFALSVSGNIYTLPAVPSQAPRQSRASWWDLSWFSGVSESPEILSHEKLRWGERFISISAGDDHLLALTSAGRTFARPITPNANNSGQLGFRKFEMIDGGEHRTVELIPRAVSDPLGKTSAFIRRKVESAPTAENATKHDTRGYCDQLFEIPALKEVKVSQIATGGRSSYVQTSTGQVLGWGANEYGQIGLGSNLILDTIIVPTEIILWQSAADRPRTKCIGLSAGGDLACFNVERKDDTGASTTDLLVCGNGQWGGLGNNLFSTAHGTPVRAKNISGLSEYCERTQTRKAIAIHAISVSPTGHVLATLDTLTRSTTENSGRDLFVWGANYEYELGNGKRGSLAMPTTVQTADGERLMLKRKKVKEIRDLSGSVWKRDAVVEQRAVAGYGNSVLYWQMR